MKAHVSAPSIAPLALCGGFSPERFAVLSAALAPLDIEARPVLSERFGCTVGELAGLDAPRPSSAAPAQLQAECLVFCALRDGQLDEALAALRNAALIVPYKAVLTPSNRSWTLARLLGELMREHEAMASRKP